MNEKRKCFSNQVRTLPFLIQKIKGGDNEMGEKSGGMTNMVIAVMIFAGVGAILSVAFPDLANNITQKMTGIVNNWFGKVTP